MSVTDKAKRAGKKVLATDTAQGVIGAVADKLEEITVDKADDAAETVKEKAAKAGGRSPQRTSAKKPTAKKTAGANKKSGARKSVKKTTGRKRSAAKKPTAKKSGAKKSGAKKSRGEEVRGEEVGQEDHRPQEVRRMNRQAHGAGSGDGREVREPRESFDGNDRPTVS